MKIKRTVLTGETLRKVSQEMAYAAILKAREAKRV